jgi:hypothetical protein
MRRQEQEDTENKEPQRDETSAAVENEIDDDEAMDEELDDEASDEDLDEDTEERSPQRSEIEHGDKGREGGSAEVDDRVAWRPEDEEPDSADRRS